MHSPRDSRPPEVIVDIAICLLHQTNFLLDCQLLRPEKGFLTEGALREHMTRARLHIRSQQKHHS